MQVNRRSPTTVEKRFHVSLRSPEGPRYRSGTTFPKGLCGPPFLLEARKGFATAFTIS